MIMDNLKKNEKNYKQYEFEIKNMSLFLNNI